MAFGTLRAGSANTLMSEINIIPLVDVMLVLMVIFIITAPLLTNAVKIDLPRAQGAPNTAATDPIELSIDAGGHCYWNGEALDRSSLSDRLQRSGQKRPTAELHIHADKNLRYQVLADVMSEASKEGVSKIGFVTDPRAPDQP